MCGIPSQSLTPEHTLLITSQNMLPIYLSSHYLRGHRAEMGFSLVSHLQQLSTKAALKVHLLKNLNFQIIFIHLTLFYRIKIRNQENQRYQGNIPCKDRHNKGQKWYGSNRSRRYILRRGGKNIQNNCTKKIFMTQITMMV